MEITLNLTEDEAELASKDNKALCDRLNIDYNTQLREYLSDSSNNPECALKVIEAHLRKVGTVSNEFIIRVGDTVGTGTLDLFKKMLEKVSQGEEIKFVFSKSPKS